MSRMQRTSTFTGHRHEQTCRIGSFVTTLLHTYVRWCERQAAKHHLATLDDRMLKDIGISRGQIDSAVTTGHRRYMRR